MSARAFRCLCGALLALPFFVEAKRMLAWFPFSFTWTELMINYRGGFVRRGLLGEMAYDLDALVPAKYFLVGFVVVSYVIALAIFVWRFPPDAAVANAAFLICPAGLLFPIYDPLAFGRKEAVIVALFAVAVLLAPRVKQAGRWLLFALISYAVAGLMMEASIFYLPAAVAVFVVVRQGTLSRRDYLLLAAATVAFFAVWCLFTVTFHAVADEAAIIASWRQRYPHAYDALGALTMFNHPLAELRRAMLQHQSSGVTLGGYLTGFFLANLPLLIMLPSRDFSRLSREAKLAVRIALAAALLPFMLAADWGRFTYLFAIHGFALVALMPMKPDRVHAWPRRPLLRALAVLLVLVYGTTWCLEHFASQGSSALRPGNVVRLFPTRQPGRESGFNP